MDSLHGQDGTLVDDGYSYDAIDAPVAVVENERRLHVRAYNHWASLLGNRMFPSIEDLHPDALEGFAHNSVLLDFSLGVENPAIIYLGEALREQCDITGPVERIADVPARSLLTRLTDHYLQIIANAAPIGFEAEFINQRGQQILYRGILMPYSSDDETIDFIYGVISWKEVAGTHLNDALNAQLSAELTASLATQSAMPAPAPAGPIWADGPAVQIGLGDLGDDDDMDIAAGEDEEDDAFLLDTAMRAPEDDAFEELCELDLGAYAADPEHDGVTIDDLADSLMADLMSEDFAPSAPNLTTSADATETAQDNRVDAADDALPSIDMMFDDALPDETLPDDALPDHAQPAATADFADMDEDEHACAAQDTAPALAHSLALAQASARDADDCAARSRAALYRAIGDAYDFALSARAEPDAYAALLEQAGIIVADRAPMTAVVKLVFGADYDKTRLAEFATALDYAMTQELPAGSLAHMLNYYRGGLKGLVADMRASRKGDAPAGPSARVERARRKLAKAAPIAIADLPLDDAGLALAFVRVEADGTLSLVAALNTDDKAAQQAMVVATRKRG